MIWRCSTAARPGDRATAGFTLLEILVVLAIFGLSLVLVSGFRPPWSKGFHLDSAAAELAAQLRLVRSQAIAGNRAAIFELDLDGRRYRSGMAAPRALPAGLAVELLTVAGERQGAAAGGIRFHPDGSSTGGRIVLTDGSKRVAIGVDWLTGRVGIDDVR